MAPPTFFAPSAVAGPLFRTLGGGFAHCLRAVGGGFDAPLYRVSGRPGPVLDVVAKVVDFFVDLFLVDLDFKAIRRTPS